MFAKQSHVLDAERRLEVLCTIDAAAVTEKPVHLRVELKDGDRIVASGLAPVRLENAGLTETALTLTDLGAISLCDVDAARFAAPRGTHSRVCGAQTKGARIT